MENHRKGVIEAEQGIAQKDGIYFHTASPFAQQHLFYPLWGATYTCLPPYCVDRREAFDFFLLFYITQGELRFHYRGRGFTAGAGSVVLLDCKPQNLYYTDGLTRFHWFHFAGAAAQAYADRLWEAHGALFEDRAPLAHYFQSILEMLRAGDANDDLLSVRIHQLLCLLAMPAAYETRLSPPIERAKALIEARFSESLTIDELAAAAVLSRYHFSRLFRRETGLSPHGYLIKTRIDHAKRLLSETRGSVEEIAEACAFCSSSNFIRAFRQSTGMTPSRFRQIF